MKVTNLSRFKAKKGFSRGRFERGKPTGRKKSNDLCEIEQVQFTDRKIADYVFYILSFAVIFAIDALL